MAVLEEKFTALETAVAEVVNILFEILAEESPDDEVADLPGKLNLYALQVEQVGLAAEAADFMGLRDLCILFQEKLEELSLQQRALVDDERLLLEEWPTLVMGFMESPNEPAAFDALIQHLQSPVWSTPLAQEDAELMKGMFALQLEDNLQAAQTEEQTAASDDSETSVVRAMTDAFATPAEQEGPVQENGVEEDQPAAFTEPESAFDESETSAAIASDDADAFASADEAESEQDGIVEEDQPVVFAESEPEVPEFVVQDDAVSTPIEEEGPPPAVLAELEALLADDDETAVKDLSGDSAATVEETVASSDMQEDLEEAHHEEAQPEFNEVSEQLTDTVSSSVEVPFEAEQSLIEQRAEALTGLADEVSASVINEEGAKNEAEDESIAIAAEDHGTEEVSADEVFEKTAEVAEEEVNNESVAIAAEDYSSEETFPEESVEQTYEESSVVVAGEEEQETDAEWSALADEQQVVYASELVDVSEEQEEQEEDEAAFVPEDTTPEVEVAGLLSIMESLPESSDADAAVAAITPEYLRHYATQVERIGLAAGAREMLGLQDVCLLFNMNLLTLVERGEMPTDIEFESLLAAWPTLVMGYLAAPADPMAGQALVEHLQHPIWPAPLAAEEAEALCSVLLPNAMESEQTAANLESLPPESEQPAPERSEIYPAHDVVAEDESAETSERVELAGDGVIDTETAFHSSTDAEATEDSESGAFLAEEEAGEFVEESDAQALAQLAATEVNEEEEDAEGAEVEEAEVETSADDGGVNSELLEILSAEIAQIDESTTDMLALVSAEETEGDDRREALTNFAEEIERLADAAEAVGLAGLHQVCAHVQANILELAAQERTVNGDEQTVLAGWPAAVSDYLNAITDRAVCQSLVHYLQDTRWPSPWPAEDAASLGELLAAPTPVMEEASVEARQELASADDVSLALPEDVNPELLDSLLQELPSQTAELSTAIQRLAEGEGSLEDVDVAQRIAHTVKGAGNTVGVRGIANLTHQLEDILLAFSKHKTLPTRALSDTLLNAADCLENMSEALLGMSAPPTQAVAVLQEVLDWANRIDKEGIPAEDDQAPPPRKPQPASPPAQAEQAPPESSATDHAAAAPLLRVPATLVDDLLRLVGESIILTGQVQERVRKTMQHTQSVQEQNLAFQQLTAELEQLVDVRGVTSPLVKAAASKGNFDPLEMEQYNELNTVTHRLLEVANDSQEFSLGVEEDLTILDTLLVDQGRLHRESQEAVLRTRMVPVKTIVPRLQRSVRQTCRLTDKEAELVVRGSDTLIDSNVLNDMTDPLMHILRNAVDHGIEKPDTRRALGKHAAGRIELSFFREGNAIVVRCQDDGAGLKLDSIRQAAEQKGLIKPGKALSEEELRRLILMPGFSTREEVTQTSGRGIGMDMVYTRIQEIKGSLNIQSTTGLGCIIELRLPVTLISTHALLVRIRDQVYAVSERGIEQILYSGVGRIHKLGTTTTYQVDEDIYELSLLDELLKLPPDRRTEDRSVRPLLLVREESGASRAVMVEEIVDSRDLVVKSMGPYIPKLQGIVGATILGDGSVAPVLDLPDLMRTPTSSYVEMPHGADAGTSQRAEIQRRYALVVDDSLSARRALAQFVEDAGFEVRTAKDGMEATEIIEAKEPDIILVDLEMPRMNGLELTSHVRSRQSSRNLPIIMITSRSTAKHIQEAEAVGVNYYLTKPFSEDDLLGRINQLLGQK